MPQAVVVSPSWQVSWVSQHPLQVPGPQEPVEQTWSMQVSGAVQAAQVSPPLPQASGAVPSMHLEPWQHPSGQELALQVVHRPSTQLSLPWQMMQASPPEPQAELVSPGMHWPPWQHPSGQELGSQPVVH
jgi:hypothetical protein